MQTVTPNPYQFGSLGYGDLGAIPRYDRDFCMGPAAIGTPVAEYTRYSHRWCAFVAPSGVRIGLIGPGFSASDSDGVLTGLYDLPGFATQHLGAAFDKNGRPVITRQLTPTTWELSKFELGVPRVFGPFEGITPLPWLTALAVSDSIDQEVVVFYVKPGGTQLFCRHESEEYDFEYVVATGLSPAIGRLTKLDYDVPTLRLWIWGMSSAAARPFTVQTLLRSKQYPPYPAYEPSDDFLEVSVGALGGAYLIAIVTVSAGTESDLALAEPGLEGVYADVIEEDSELDDSTLDANVDLEGAYELQMVEDSESDDSDLDVDVDLEGEYADVIRPTGTVGDAVDMDVGLSGVYEAV